MICSSVALIWIWWALGIGAWWATYPPVLQHLRRWIPERKGPRPDMGSGLAFFIAMLLGTFVWAAGLGFSDRVICENPRPDIEQIRQEQREEIDNRLRRQHGL